MTYSEIKIRFTSDFEIGYILKIIGFSADGMGFTWTERWSVLRSSTSQVTTGTPTTVVGERAAIQFVNAFELDYNFPVQYQVTRLGNEVTIKSLIPEIEFSEGYVTLRTGEIIEEVAEFEITNFEGSIFEITYIQFQESSNPCNTIGIYVETSELTTKILSPFVLNDNTENPFYFEPFRGRSFTLIIQNENGVEISRAITVPDALNSANFTLNPSSTPNGGTLDVIKTNSNLLDIEYSLDNFDWQEEPFFSGLEPGNYTLYVRDQYGCSFEATFFISEFNIQTPYFYYSKSNSIRMAERVDFALIPKNDENTLSCESWAKLPFKEVQNFNSADNVTIQFKSNLSNNTAKIIDESGVITDLTVIKKTNNIGNKEKRDAVIYRYTSSKSGVYFINGNTYDFDTNAVNGTYLLNGLLPVWAQIGKFIVIDSVWFLIENIIFEESKNADVLIINKVTELSFFDQSVIVGSVFNIQDYEVYETTMVLGAFFSQNIRLKIEASDADFSNVTYLSELINVQESHPLCLEIRYFNIENNDVFYQTGIEHLLRMPFTKINGYYDDSSENNKTDASVISLSVTLYEGNEFVFEPVTTEMWRKLSIALSHKLVFIDGVGYVKDGEIEVEGPLEDTNLYVVKAKMLKTGKSYNNLSSGSIGLANDPIIEIPGMIEWDGGFIEQ
jgi:hypothetical protein